jgi:hypothetical protein
LNCAVAAQSQPGANVQVRNSFKPVIRYISQRFTGIFGDDGHTITGLSKLSHHSSTWDDDLATTLFSCMVDQAIKHMDESGFGAAQRHALHIEDARRLGDGVPRQLVSNHNRGPIRGPS